MSAATNIVDLRRMLAERFPGAHVARPRDAAEAGNAGVPTGVPALDALLGGGLAKGEVTELVGVGPGSGTAQVLHALLACVAKAGGFLALVDGADSLDLAAPEAAELARLLWVRCRTAEEALKSTDLLLRDRNFPVVVLDLKLNPASQLRGISASVWHRFARLAGAHGTTLLVVTPQAMVGAVAVRVEARARLGLGALAATAGERLGQLEFEVRRAVPGSGALAAAG